MPVITHAPMVTTWLPMVNTAGTENYIRTETKVYTVMHVCVVSGIATPPENK